MNNSVRSCTQAKSTTRRILSERDAGQTTFGLSTSMRPIGGEPQDNGSFSTPDVMRLGLPDIVSMMQPIRPSLREAMVQKVVL